MYTEFAIAEVYVPPFFIYVCASIPLYFAFKIIFSRAGVLRRVWHPALFEFSISLILISLLALYF